MMSIQEWWEHLRDWCIASPVGGKRGNVEDYLETTESRDLAQQWEDFLTTNGWRYPQILRGGGKPSDRPDELDFIPNIVGWGDYEVHEWEGPEGKGWVLYIYVKEGNTDWVLNVTRPWVAPEWRLVEEVTP